MEWSKVNGDVRFNFGRDGAYVPRGSEPSEHPQGGFQYGPGPPSQSRIELIPNNNRGFAKGPGVASRAFGGIQEYSFSQGSSRDSPEQGGFTRVFISGRKGSPPASAFSQGFDSDQECPPFPILHDSDQGCQSDDVCSECPARGAPCDFGPQGSGPCFHSDVECPIRPNLRTGADGRLVSGDPRSHPHPEVYHLGISETSHQEPMSHSHQECGDPRTFVIAQGHSSHCDLKEFHEWRDTRGSRESLGTLPPDLERHLRECRCQCDHLGYGNYQTLSDGPVAHISRTHSCSSESFGRKEGAGGGGPSSVYTQILYLDSPRSTSSNGFPNRRKVPGELSTKHWWLVGLVFLVAACAGVGVGVPLALRGDPSKTLEQRVESAKRILSESPLIDGHNDLPWNIRSFIHNQLEKLQLNDSLKKYEPWSNSNWSQTDIPRLKEGRVGGVFWVAYTPCATQYLNTVQLTLEQIDLIKRVIQRYKDYMKLVTSANEIQKVFKEGKIASLVGIEGGHSISNSLGTLRMMYELGARYLTLTHACNTPWATSSIVESQKIPGFEHVGLNDFGKKVVLEMNRLGMMVDLSHVSTQTMRDALATTQAPIIFSHSSARALCKNPRNVPDDILEQVKSNRGIVMVSFFADHVNCNGQANVTHVADHIKHIRKIAGIDHVGIGADFDGINKTPEGLEDVSKYPLLIAELLRDKDWTGEDIRKLAGENIIRVFTEVEKVRDDLQAKGYEPFEEEIHPDYIRGKTNCSYFFDTVSRSKQNL